MVAPVRPTLIGSTKRRASRIQPLALTLDGSYSYKLFVVAKDLNPFGIKQIHTLCTNAPFASRRRLREHPALYLTPGRSNVPTLLFATAWSLFVASLPSFRRSLPLFSIAYSLFSKNTRVGGIRMWVRRPV